MDSALPQKSLTSKLLAAVFPELCLECGVRISRDNFFCDACGREGILKPVGLIPVEDGIARKFAFLYEGAAKTLFAAAKFSERRRAVDFLKSAAREDLENLSAGSALVLALPSRKKFLRGLLAANVAKQKLIPDAFRIQKRRFGGDANKLLGEAERYRRIHQSLVWNGVSIPPAERYVLCDDVSTTGATLNHAAHLVQENLGISKSQITLWSLMYRERLFAPVP